MISKLIIIITRFKQKESYRSENQYFHRREWGFKFFTIFHRSKFNSFTLLLILLTVDIECHTLNASVLVT